MMLEIPTSFLLIMKMEWNLDKYLKKIKIRLKPCYNIENLIK